MQETFEEKVLRIGKDMFGDAPSIAEAMKDEGFVSICKLIKAVIEEDKPRIQLL